MRSLYLRLAAPLQSWASVRVQGHHVHTNRIPTRSGLEGLIAAALGARQGEWPHWLSEVQIEVRVDNAGRVQDEFQTINPRPESERFLKRMWIATGGKKTGPTSFTPAGKGTTTIVRRSYLASAEFTVKLSHPERVDEIAQAFANPGFSPYLGRKAFAPTFPFLLGVGGGNMLETAPSGTAGPLGVHLVDGKANVYPRETVCVTAASLPNRMDWWAAHATIPEYLST